jgi:hypothetical protein
LVVCLSPALACAQTNFAIPWFKIAGGGSLQSTGGVYALSGTIGQTDAGRVAATTVYRIEGGFWAIALQQLGYPTLHITPAGTNVLIRWESLEPGFLVQSSTNLASPSFWSDLGAPVTTNGVTNLVTVPVAPGAEKTFFRLRRP